MRLIKYINFLHLESTHVIDFAEVKNKCKYTNECSKLKFNFDYINALKFDSAASLFDIDR